jgi:hypothetical protein
VGCCEPAACAVRHGPHFLPDGDPFFYSAASGVFVSALAVASGHTGPIRVLDDFVNVQYVPDTEVHEPIRANMVEPPPEYPHLRIPLYGIAGVR